MRMLATIAVGASVAFSGVGEAVAQNAGPVIVIPTRRDVPVVLYGRDVSYVVVESDWGLARPGHMAPAIIGYAPPVGDRASPLRGVNYPRYGVAPPRGRKEAEAPNRPPEHPETFSRSWGAQSPGVVAPPPAYQRPLDPIYPTDPNGYGPGPQSQNGFPPLSAQSDIVAPATVIDPQTFTMPPVIVDQRGRRRNP